MFNPTDASTSRSHKPASEETLWHAGATHAECELCQSMARTSVEYGICVCHDCDDTYLP